MLAEFVLFINKQGEIIQTAANFIKKSHFKVPEQAFLFVRIISEFYISSTPGSLAEMSDTIISLHLEGCIGFAFKKGFTFKGE